MMKSHDQIIYVFKFAGGVYAVKSYKQINMMRY